MVPRRKATYYVSSGLSALHRKRNVKKTQTMVSKVEFRFLRQVANKSAFGKM